MAAAPIRAQRSVRQGCRHVSGGLAVEQAETGCVSVSWRGRGRVGYSGVMAKVNDPQEQAASLRDRRLRARPHWDDLELRLRHRWSPRQVVAWYRERWPAERPPSVPTLYRFLQDQEAWFVPELVDTRRLPRVLALEEHAHLTITQFMRVKRAIALEEQFQM